MKRFLLINTAAEPAVIGVATADRLLAEATVAARGHLSEYLLARIDDLLRQTKTPLQSLAALGIVVGPGSFTGLRLGVAVTNALASSQQLPIVSVTAHEVPSLSAFAILVARRLGAKQTSPTVLPTYGKAPTITPPVRHHRQSGGGSKKRSERQPKPTRTRR